MAVSAVARIVELLRIEGATEDEIFDYLTDKRRGVGLSRQEAVTCLRWEENVSRDETGAAVDRADSDYVAMSALFPADLVRTSAHTESGPSLGCLAWVVVPFVLAVVFAFAADPLLRFVCASGLDSSNHAACRLPCAVSP